MSMDGGGGLGDCDLDVSPPSLVSSAVEAPLKLQYGVEEKPLEKLLLRSMAFRIGVVRALVISDWVGVDL